jgi:hypothetical protein
MIAHLVWFCSDARERRGWFGGEWAATSADSIDDGLTDRSERHPLAPIRAWRQTRHQLRLAHPRSSDADVGDRLGVVQAAVQGGTNEYGVSILVSSHAYHLVAGV